MARLNAGMKIVGMVVLAALMGWFVRGIRFNDPPAPEPPRAEQPVVVNNEPVAAPQSVHLRAPHHVTSPGNRNLFAYRIHERPAVTMPIPDPAPVLVTPPPIVIVEPPVPLPIPFPYRYFGTFGPAHNRVAAFKRDGDIITLRAGERIGDFVLRTIGIESAEVEGPDGVRRIPLSSDV